MSKELLTVVTHSGNFHTDDVFACATLLLAYKEKDVQIIRSRDEQAIAKADIVVDVGGIHDVSIKRFDHHQKEGAGKRENNIPYASFGLVWQAYGEILCESREAMLRIDEHIVAPIDAGDNGVELVELKTDISPYKISSLVGVFNASWTEDAERVNDENFFKMVAWAQNILQREMIHANDFIKAEGLVEQAYKVADDKRVIVLDGPYPADDVLKQYPEPLYIVKLRQDKRWGVKCVSNDESHFSRRKELPTEWAGLRDEELQKVTGVPDAVFCHKNLFMALAESKEGALELARLAVEY